MLCQRSCLTTFVVYLLAHQAAGRALDLLPIAGPPDVISNSPSKRSAAKGLDLLPIPDPSVLTHGRFLRREQPGHACFDPSSTKSFFWGIYSGDNIYVANFTLDNPGDDEYILPVEDFAKELKSIHCGSTSSPYMNLEFKDQDSFAYAKSAWDWVNKEDINKFTVVTEPNQCFDGDNRSPYLVRNIEFDEKSLKARLHAVEKKWAEVAHTFKLHLGHQYVEPSTVNVTHPHLIRREEKVLDLTNDWDLRLFEFGQNSEETSGLQLTADAQISTGGQIISDFDIETKFFIPRDVKLSIKPQGLHALFLLKLQANGKLGKPLDFALQPEIEIPVAALNIKGILEIGPFITMGVHLGSSALEGTASVKAGAGASIDDSAEINVKLRNPEDNGISGWTPKFEKLDTNITASIQGSVKAFAELAITIKAEAFGKWGYQASLEAQLPYFEASFDASFDNNGVCGTQKTAGVELEANVGININLNAGEVDEAPKFEKELFETSWPLFSTCFPFGGDVAPTAVVGLPEAPAIETKVPVLPPVAHVPAEPEPQPVHPSTTELMEPSPTWNPDEKSPSLEIPHVPVETSVEHPVHDPVVVTSTTTTEHAVSTTDYHETTSTSSPPPAHYTYSDAHPLPPLYTSSEVHPLPPVYTSTEAHGPPPAAYTSSELYPPPSHYTPSEVPAPPPAYTVTEVYHAPPAAYTPIHAPPPPEAYTPVHPPSEAYETPEAYTPIHPPPEPYETPEAYTPVHPAPEPYKTPEAYTPIHPPPEPYNTPESHPPVAYVGHEEPAHPEGYEATETATAMPSTTTPCKTTLVTSTKTEYEAYYV